MKFDFDPFDPQYWENPYPYYAEMRHHSPVFKKENEAKRVWPHYWMISRATDVNDALFDWKTFSSATGTLIDTDATLLPETMFHMDPPRHDQLRSILSRVLTPSRIANLEPVVRKQAQELVDAFKARGTADVVTEFARSIPTMTMCTLMNLPWGEHEKFLTWNLATLGGADFTSPEALQAWGEMDAYWKGLVVERRKERTDDLVSMILHAQVEGENLSNEEISGFCGLLHDASQNTTINMICNAIISLGRYPDQQRKLRDDPGLWSTTALEELLRFESPVQGLARSTTCDVTVSDVTIPAGDQVLLLYGSANHDETVFEDPDVLDIERPVKTHWTFGHGIHYCLGNAVARLETRVSLQVLLETIPMWDIDNAGIERGQLVPTRGVNAAPISFEPAKG
jgi:cytochrome P450